LPPAAPHADGAGMTTMLVRAPADTRGLWLRWVGANAGAEGIGLGVSALVAVTVLAWRPVPLPVAFVAVLAAGAFEGLVVGGAQWRVLRRPFPHLGAGAWVGATVAGAVVAWALGMLPSTLMDMDGAAQGPPISDGVQYLLAAGMGLALGPVLGIPQWLVLRRHVPRAGWWVPANAVAWAAGMPVIFAVAGGVPAGLPVLALAALVLGTLTLAGAIVGAMHGVVLVRLLGQPDPGEQPPAGIPAPSGMVTGR
jgi:hypothetical protein